MKTDKILVVGASGTVGSEIVKLLQASGYAVRQTTSRPSNTSSDQVHLNLVTGEGIKDAFAGVERAFLISPPGYDDQYAILAPLIQEAKRRGLKKVVLMTAMGANAVETSPFRRAELELERSGISYNIIRPNWFLQNFNTFWLHGIQTEGKILLPAGTAKVSFIDARDIAAVAARLLVDDSVANRDFDLTGPESVTHDEVASAIAKTTGKKVVYEEVSPDDFKKGLIKAGLPEGYSNFLVMIFGFLREGYASAITPHVQNLLGRTPRGLDTYVQDYVKSWS